MCGLVLLVQCTLLFVLGGNFCAGYDLKELAHGSGSLKLEQDVCRGPGPMVRVESLLNSTDCILLVCKIYNINTSSHHLCVKNQM